MLSPPLSAPWETKSPEKLTRHPPELQKMLPEELKKLMIQRPSTRRPKRSLRGARMPAPSVLEKRLSPSKSPAGSNQVTPRVPSA